jgi:hypothetical protein
LIDMANPRDEYGRIGIQKFIYFCPECREREATGS